MRGEGSEHVQYDEYGRRLSSLKQITKKPVLPSESEVERNSRAASAKLRAIEKM